MADIFSITFYLYLYLLNSSLYVTSPSVPTPLPHRTVYTTATVHEDVP